MIRVAADRMHLELPKVGCTYFYDTAKYRLNQETEQDMERPILRYRRLLYSIIRSVFGCLEKSGLFNAGLSMVCIPYPI